MKTHILSFFISFITLFAIAQKSPVKFGDIQMKDLTMSSYPEDSSAAAVILVDYGEAYVSVGTVDVSLNFERHVRIKILKKAGLRWADALIPLFYAGSNEEKVIGLKAASYNLEGGKIVETKMSKDGVFDEKYNKNIKLKKFTIPNVKEGSVIEYSYRVSSDFLDNFPNWQFQYSIPVQHSEYWAILPNFFIFEKYMQGYIPATSYEVKDKQMSGYQAKGHHWVIKDVPAFKEEPYMTSEDDYVAKINLALSHINFPGQPVREIMGSWAKMNANLLDRESFGKTITGNNFLKKITEEVTTGITDPKQKMAAIYTYVRNTLEWNGTKDYLADPLKKVFELKKGTTGDINLAVASMLEKADIPVDMVLLSTRDHGFIRPQSPMERQFNYVVCAARINGETILMDATERYLPIGVLPERCLNGQGLMISKTHHGWVDLKPKVKIKTVVDADLTLDESGRLKGKLNMVHDGYDASAMRKDYLSKGKDAYLKNFINASGWHIEESEFQDIEKFDTSAKENHLVTISEHTTVAGDMIYINPFITAQQQSNPFVLEQREYPVDFGAPLEKVYMCKLAVPAGYIVDELPQSKMFMLPGNGARYLFNVVHNGNWISITSNMSINKSLFTQAEYPNLREFYNQVVAKQAEQIVLKKKQ